MRGGPAITVDALRVAFGDFTAIDDLSLAIDYGEVRALIGPNGAGKTTLLDVISGITRAAGGSVTLDGLVDLTGAAEATIARAGVRRKFQKPSVFDALSVGENLDVGLAGRLRGEEARDEIERILAIIGLTAERDRTAGVLAHGQKQWLEIGMVLAGNPKVLMLDEPVAGLTDEETRRTAELVLSLKSPERAIVVVEHDMDFVALVADRVTVLHEGRTLFEGSMAAARADARVIDVYLGRSK
jgi:urea transport system ATP-binding protein